MFPKYNFFVGYNMMFEYIVINNIQGVGVGKVFMFWDIAPKEIIFFADFYDANVCLPDDVVSGELIESWVYVSSEARQQP